MDQKVYVRLIPKNSLTLRQMMKFQNFPRLELKVSLKLTILQLIEHLQQKWFQNQNKAISLYPDPEKWDDPGIKNIQFNQYYQIYDVNIAYNSPQDKSIYKFNKFQKFFYKQLNLVLNIFYQINDFKSKKKKLSLSPVEKKLQLQFYPDQQIITQKMESNNEIQESQNYLKEEIQNPFNQVINLDENNKINSNQMAQKSNSQSNVFKIQSKQSSNSNFSFSKVDKQQNFNQINNKVIQEIQQQNTNNNNNNLQIQKLINIIDNMDKINTKQI